MNIDVQIAMCLKTIFATPLLDHIITVQDIKDRWKRLAKRFHTDIQDDLGGEYMQSINSAKDFLIENLDAVNRFIITNDPTLRAAYEKERETAERNRQEAERAATEEKEREQRKAEKAQRAAAEKKRKEEEARQEQKRKEEQAKQEKIRQENARREQERAEAERLRRERERRRQEEEKRRIEKQEEETFLSVVPKKIQSEYLKITNPVQRPLYRQKYYAKKAKMARIRKIVTPIAICAVIITAVTVFLAVMSNSNYGKAQALFEKEEYVQAEDLFRKAIFSSDADDMQVICQAHIAENNGQIEKAALLYGSVDNAECYQKSRELFWDVSFSHEVVAMSDNDHVFAVLKDGTLGYGYRGDDNFLDLTNKLSEWKNIIHISADYGIAAVVKEDGSVDCMSTRYGDAAKQKRKIKSWKNVVAVYVCDGNVIGLTASGSILATSNAPLYKEIKKWKNIIDLDHTDYEYSNNYDTTIERLICAVDTDGKCHSACSVSDLFKEECETINTWSDICNISVSGARHIGLHIVGLKKDGTVVAAGTNHNGVCNVESWSNITYIHTNTTYTYGVNANGTVNIVGADAFSKKDVSNIKDALWLADVENLLVIDKHGNFQCQKDKTTFFDQWSSHVRMPSVRKIEND